jgi:hypothetical protein
MEAACLEHLLEIMLQQWKYLAIITPLTWIWPMPPPCPVPPVIFCEPLTLMDIDLKDFEYQAIQMVVLLPLYYY